MDKQNTDTDRNDGREASECGELLTTGPIEAHHDQIAEKLDEMADLCEYWKKNREKGRDPGAIRAALVMLSEEIVLLTNMIDLEKEKAVNRIAKRLGLVGG